MRGRFRDSDARFRFSERLGPKPLCYSPANAAHSTGMMVDFSRGRSRPDTARELLRERAAIASNAEARAEQKLSEAFLGGYVMRRNSVKLSALLACAIVGGAVGL